MIDLRELQVSRTVVVAAPPEQVYDLIADVTRVGELSPVCKGGLVGRGRRALGGGMVHGPPNEMEGTEPWERHCEVIVAERARALRAGCHPVRPRAPPSGCTGSARSNT